MYKEMENYQEVKEFCDDYGFRFLDHVEEPAVQLVAVGWQRRSSRGYYWDNKNRPDCFLFQYTLNGSGTLKTAESVFTIKKGEGFLVHMPEEESYYFDEENDQAPWEFVYIMFRGRAVDAYYQYIINHAGKVLAIAPNHQAIRQLKDLYFQARDGMLKNVFMAEGEVFQFLCALCDASSGEKRHSGLIDRAKAYIEQNYDQPVTLAEVAGYLGVSQSHFTREFVRYTGEQPIRYLTKIRLEQSMKLLHATDMKLEEISAACGFSDCNYFSKVFKKYMKESPGELRRQMKAQGYVRVKV